MFSYHGNWSLHLFLCLPYPKTKKKILLLYFSVEPSIPPYTICIRLGVKMMWNIKSDEQKKNERYKNMPREYKTETGSIYRRYYETNENSFMHYLRLEIVR